MTVGSPDSPGDQPGRPLRTRVALLAGVGVGLGLAIGAAIGAWVFDDEGTRFDFDGLSCTTDSWTRIAIDGVPVPDPDAALVQISRASQIDLDEWTVVETSGGAVVWEHRQENHPTGRAWATYSSFDGGWFVSGVQLCG